MVEKYIKIRMKQLEEELEKNPSAENYLIFTKAIQELSLVLDRERQNKAKAPLLVGW